MKEREMGRSRKKKPNLQRCDRRQKNQPTETLPPPGAAETDGKDKAKISGEGPTRFFGCYLLSSLSPRYKGHSYIGFTVNPKRRIRQHNGEITSGASKTKRKRPWEMVFCIHGFPAQVSALQFEWAWQHPKESVAVREIASNFKTLGGLPSKIKLALTMLTLPSWNSMELTVSFFSTKYMSHTAGCPNLPPQMKLHFCSMDELPRYSRGNHPYGCDDQDGEVYSSRTRDFDHLVDEQETSIDIERLTEQNSNESIFIWDQRDLDGSFDQICSFSDKESASRQFLADILSNEMCSEIQRDYSSPSRGDSSPLVIDKFAKKDDTTYVLINDSTNEQRCRTYEKLPSSVEGIEVIDLFTPSTECRLVSGSKKRRVTRDPADIIDLTRSPFFVEQ